jgi:hypothetical protein
LRVRKFFLTFTPANSIFESRFSLSHKDCAAVLQCCGSKNKGKRNNGIMERWNGGMGGMLEEWKKKNVTSSGLAS